MMATTAVIGLSAGKRLLSSSFYYSDLNEKLTCCSDHTLPCHQVPNSVKNVITAKKSSDYSPSCVSSRKLQSAKAVKEHVDIASDPSDVPSWFEMFEQLQNESDEEDVSMEVLLLLQKYMLEKQWNLSIEKALTGSPQNEKNCEKMHITGSGTSARRRRMHSRQRVLGRKISATYASATKPLRSVIGRELLQNRLKGYVKGVVSEELLTHTEVLQLSKKIQVGLYMEEQKSRLKERLGCEPSDDQLAISLKMSRTDLQSTLIECSLARERLAMSNVRLVMSIAQIYDNMGAEMADLVQAGLIGLLRGIEKFDPSKGYKISTYVYWWIRQGVSRALVENSRTLRLPTHLHERLGLIRNAKMRLEEKGVTPSVNNIAASLNMSHKKVKNATEASSKVYSLDREAFPSLNGLPGETLHSYIADNHLENNPWHGVDVWALKDEVNNLISSTLREREREIIRLYYGLDSECLTWEDISKRIGLSRERVRQVGLVALEKLKHAARKRRLDAMLIKQ
ncbi:RNA polymerase sigma factor sigA-like [Lycium barbarum]|uniref:RNA polymerase sigma factor sigA-like n=1 Tax=Lycium barbarum TaxID=112863 RepID=UPI00293F4EEC|nr:RNA polymerase sigma factor sigA-like [Lycium barbarum]XP_060204137.1 RNA polymerase sigma factor sigA-like [Lycium barbarum]XP_060204138.1 RNA polymerase sigma factor sigA-like [Lycium barbarum]